MNESNMPLYGSQVTMAEDNSLLKIHLRLRQSKSKTETTDAYYVDEEDPTTLVATAPLNTETHKNAQRNHTLAIQKFKFSNIFIPKTAQSELFESTTVPMLDECLNMEHNCLLFTYGVTASGKTHTVQGPRHDAGLLPRSLDLIFNTIGSHIKPKSIYCPNFYNDVCKMTEKLQAQKETLKQRILYPPNTSQEINLTGITDPNSTKCTVGSIISEYEDTSYQITDNVTVQLTNTDNVEYSIWVSYVELYNENIYDLLHPPSEHGVVKPKDRPTLRLGEDRSMSVYIKGAAQLEVCSFAEASRVLAYGQRNRKIAATSMNQSSSRSHTIFRINIIATNTQSQQSKCSQFTFVDLAGSERYGKTNAVGVRLKEAGNINTSLLTLGKCISALRHNSKVLKPGRSSGQAQIVPFRESKLTRLFKTFLSGEGRITMIVCVNTNPDMFDETIHALKFSALASETLLIPQPCDNASGGAGRDTHRLTEQEIDKMRWEIREDIFAEVNKIRKRERLQQEELLEATKARERRYYEGQEEDLQDYYANVIKQLKDKIREARAGNWAGEQQEEEEEEEEGVAELQGECVRLKTELTAAKSQHEKFKSGVDQTLFHTKLELKTTQQLYNAELEEKDRLLALLAEKEQESKDIFQANEESTKSATFWQGEYNILKAAHAQQSDEHSSVVRQQQSRLDHLERELNDKTQLIEKMSREKLLQNDNTHEIRKLTEQLQSLKEDLYREKTTNMSSLELLTSANTRNMELEREVTGQRDLMDRLKVSKDKDRKEISELQRNCAESKEMSTRLKRELQNLQEVLSSHDNKENVNKDLEEVRSDLLRCRELLVERNSTIKELNEELADLVRNKSLQFDTLICNKERECDELTTTVETKSARVLELERRVVELESLAGVQKGHLTTVERESEQEKERLSRRITQLEEEVSGHNKTPVNVCPINSEQLAEVDRLDTKLRLELELAKQECDRLKVELATAHRRGADDVKQLKVTLDAKNIELDNWYTEKEKAIALISTKKEREITALEEKLGEKEKQICGLEKRLAEKEAGNKLFDENRPAPGPGPGGVSTVSEEVLAQTCKLTDMVVQLEEERDNLRADYQQYVSEMNAAISVKEEEFRTLRATLDTKSTQVTGLEATLDTKTTLVTGLEARIEQLQREMEVISRRHKQVSLDSDLDQGSVSSDSTRTSTQSTSSRTSTRKPHSNRSSNTSTGRTSTTLSTGRTSTTLRTNSKRTTRSAAPKRTSQISLKSLNATRSKKSRVLPIPESPVSDFMTPEVRTTGVKRKATLKGLKNLIIGSSPNKRGKSVVDIIDISESDSGADFVTPTQPATRTRGKRKLHKSQISTPTLLSSPSDMSVRDVERPATETKSTRSHTKLIQQHLSGSGMVRKTRSRNTRI